MYLSTRQYIAHEAEYRRCLDLDPDDYSKRLHVYTLVT